MPPDPRVLTLRPTMMSSSGYSAYESAAPSFASPSRPPAEPDTEQRGDICFVEGLLHFAKQEMTILGLQEDGEQKGVQG